MAYGFGTWDANGVDNNTGLVKINALGVMQVSAGYTGSQSFNLPSGYTMDFLVQQAGAMGSGRRRISVSGNTITVSSAGSGDYSEGTWPATEANILAFAR